MVNVGVIGASGYAGAELVRILAAHPETKIVCLTCRKDAGERFDHLYPSLSAWGDMTCDAYDLETFKASKVDVVFTALPHQLPMAIVPELLANGMKVVDLSADFRIKDVSVYESYYQTHSAKELLPTSVYGLSEIYTDQIAKADLIGNPGCYPTSILLPLAPLLKSGLIDSRGIVADSKSGVSGAGRSATAATHFCHVNESFKAYKVAAHRHTPEIEAILSEQAGRQVSCVFVPHLLPMTRGMESSIYAAVDDGVSEKDIEQCFRDFYGNKPFVRLRHQSPPDTLHVKGTNFIDIAWKIDRHRQRLVLMAAIDNLVKGAAGQAVQNMNLMLGLPETTGLWQPPYPL